MTKEEWIKERDSPELSLAVCYQYYKEIVDEKDAIPEEEFNYLFPHFTVRHSQFPVNGNRIYRMDAAVDRIIRYFNQKFELV